MSKLELYNLFMNKIEGIQDSPIQVAPKKYSRDIEDAYRARYDNNVFKNLVSVVGTNLNSMWSILGITPKPMDDNLLRKIEQKSDVVDAVIKRITEDVLSVGYKFVPSSDKNRKNISQYNRVVNLFKHPSKDDCYDSWLSGFIHDIALYSNGYIEIGGLKDHIEVVDKRKVWICDGYINMISFIPAYTIKMIPGENGELPDSPNPAFIQELSGSTIYFSNNKVFHVGKYIQNRVYGVSPLQSLLSVVNGSVNLTEYVSRLYQGNVPKHIMNVGGMGEEEVRRMFRLIRQQIETADAPYGVVTVNIPGDDFKIQRIFDTANEGRFLEQLQYYREEVAAVYGIPLQKLNWSKDDKPATPSALDTYYDVIESYHRLIESVINNYILPRLEVTDWKFQFNSPRPAQQDIRATIAVRLSRAGTEFRKGNLISINEWRKYISEILEYEFPPIEDERAKDVFYIPPQPMPFKPVGGSDSPSGNDGEQEHKPGEGSGNPDK